MYKIIRVPKASPRFADLVTKSRSTRLHVLETDPTSFISKHAVEAALPVSVWQKRLSNPETTILACVAAHDDTDDSDPEMELIHNQWVGFVAVRGPMQYEDYYVTPDMGLPVPEEPEEETRWHIYDLYILPEHRGKGLARRLVKECIASAVKYTEAMKLSLTPPEDESKIIDNSRLSRNGVGMKQARIRLFMNPKNTWLITVYESMGFAAAGRVTLEEGFRANAVDESIPVDTRETEELIKMWHTRYGLAMEQIVSPGSE